MNRTNILENSSSFCSSPIQMVLITGIIQILAISSKQHTIRTVHIFYDNDSMGTSTILLADQRFNYHPYVKTHLVHSKNFSSEENCFHEYAKPDMATVKELYSGDFSKKPLTTENKIHIFILLQPTANRLMTLFQQISQSSHFHERHLMLIVFDGCCGEQCAGEAKEILLLFWLHYRYSRTSIMQGECNGMLLLNIHTFHPYSRLCNSDSWQWTDDELCPMANNSFETIYLDRTDNLYGNEISTEIRMDLDTMYYVTAAAAENWSEELAEQFRLSGANMYFLCTLAEKLNASLDLKVPLWYTMADTEINSLTRKFIRIFYHPIKVIDWIFKKEATFLNITYIKTYESYM